MPFRAVVASSWWWQLQSSHPWQLDGSGFGPWPGPRKAWQNIEQNMETSAIFVGISNVWLAVIEV